MPFEPDIVVIEPDGFGIALVAGAKLFLRDLEGTESQLKQYMSAARCPVGMIVTPQRLLLYRDKYFGPPEDSVQRVGDFDITGLIDYSPSRDPIEFERVAQSWLESLASESILQKLPGGLRGAVELYILPALWQGAVHAAHPRQPLGS